MTNYTKTQEKAINNYLTECIKNNHHCQHCAKNDNGVCFFALQCFMNDMKHFDDGDEDYKVPNGVDETNYDNHNNTVTFTDSEEFGIPSTCDGDCMECHEPCQMNQDIPDDVDETNYDPYCGCDMYEVDEAW